MTGMEFPQPFFEWSTPDFAPEVYRTRREKLLALLQESGGVMLVPARHGPDHDTFRQTDNFNYFTGLEVPESVLVVDAKKGVSLYIPRKDMRFIAPTRPNDFPGRDLLDSEEFCNAVDIKPLLPMDEFNDLLKTLENRPVFIPMSSPQPINSVSTSLFFHWDTCQGLAYHLANTTSLNLKNGFEMIAKLRMIKGPEEVEAVRRAVEITEDSILETLPILAAGVDERTVIGKLEYGFKKRGAQRVAFDSIVKTAANAHCPWRILGSHYNRRNQIMSADDVVVFDVGAEINHYGCDMGRTFPVGEKFTPLQRDAITRVHDAVLAITEAIKPGVYLSDLREIAFKTQEESHRRHMHVDSYFGHHIGLAPGDPSLHDVPLEAGMLFTIEPWYYNHVDHVSVFTEENIVVTETGVEVLTKKIPYTAGGLEKVRQAAFIK